ncbi:peroxiredoxin [Mucilaginibacter myungsuensis]|uniref:thioredoxin-dependent peroxiredoxin n=1 Tax=Mucilaginibacter myungsuensis TaxID=649104 RepID=A0A929KT09_9SPHI|nr:peroxiredoxin [Mucilaginibacter myungsuensis]MBE9661001.1 peroxiredoxin [Mucilaginibacter myungsuensis]MDN3597145.1 peroxiredoxin [Mucilaginibacter myungsuensis]
MAQSKKHLAVGDAVPVFSLTDQDGKAFNIKDHIGKHKLVIFFYPKDQSMVCTKEACQFRDSFKEFTDAGAKVIGINSGTVASHKAFAEADKLPYTLLSDPDNKVLNMFGVKSKMFMTGRETFVIGLDGKIAYQHAAMMEGKAHSDNALQFVKGSKN